MGAVLDEAAVGVVGAGHLRSRRSRRSARSMTAAAWLQASRSRARVASSSSSVIWRGVAPGPGWQILDRLVASPDQVGQTPFGATRRSCRRLW